MERVFYVLLPHYLADKRVKERDIRWITLLNGKSQIPDTKPDFQQTSLWTDDTSFLECVLLLFLKENIVLFSSPFDTSCCKWPSVQFYFCVCLWFHEVMLTLFVCDFLFWFVKFLKFPPSHNRLWWSFHEKGTDKCWHICIGRADAA